MMRERDEGDQADEADDAVAARGRIVAVHRGASHHFSKPTEEDGIRLIAGIGVEGDAHAGVTVRHRSRVARDPSAPNLRQVHLLHGELFDELVESGFAIFPGELGENITTRGVDLLGLPTGTRLRFQPVDAVEHDSAAVVEITGLRNPCSQLDRFHQGLMNAVLGRDAQGSLVRKAGIMGIVIRGGVVRAGDVVVVNWPPGLRRPLQPV